MLTVENQPALTNTPQPVPELPGPILVLIPAYNESQHISQVVKQAVQYLPVLVIDDGSNDNTSAKAELAGAEVLRQVPNQGKGAALMNGFRHSLKKGYHAIIMLDADGQHDPNEIPQFLQEYIENKPDLIIGKRDFRFMPRFRRSTNTFGTWTFSWAVGQNIPDNQSGYRLLSRRMMEAMIQSRETNFEFEVEMIVTCIQHHFHMSWVPIRTIYGDQKSHIRPLRHAFHFFRMVLQTRKLVKKKPDYPQ